MMRWTWRAAVAGAMLITGAGLGAHAQVVQPAYTGDFGNPETVALRPYKWLWSGAKSLVWHPVTEFRRGNMKFPVAGTAQTARGVRIGAIELGESAFRGMIFQQVPRPDRYKQTGRVNEVIQDDPLLRNVADAVVTVPALPVPVYPVQKVVDWHPIETDEEVMGREIYAQEVRAYRQQREAELAQARRNQELARQYGGRIPEGKAIVEEPAWKQAQRRYLGDRYVEHERAPGTGDLRRLRTMITGEE